MVTITKMKIMTKGGIREMNKAQEYAYDELYLEPNMDLHRLLFVKLAENEQYSFCSLVNNYMQTSEIRRKQDEGNWSALNKGYKQLLNSIDLSGCESKDKNEFVDDIMAHWIADIYVLFQWMYNIPSDVISKNVPAEEMIKIYNPLHETSEKNACEKIYQIYFS